MNIIEKTYSLNGKLSIRSATTRIILHHADASNCTADDVDRWHKNNRWECIGYHFFVRKDGSVYRGRQENAVGAHAYGSNYDSIGICFEGKYETEQMPDVQVKAGKELVAYLKNKYKISKVQRHKDVNNTSCPGKNFKFEEIANGQVSSVIVEKKEATGTISTIQFTLNSRYGFNIAVDNIYGNETHTALVKALQTELNKQFNKGLAVDGIFGNLTKNACVVVEKGDSGNITYLIQAMLICKGYELEADSIFGNDTDSKVKEFQSKNNLTVDAKVGKNTFAKLFA